MLLLGYTLYLFYIFINLLYTPESPSWKALVGQE